MHFQTLVLWLLHPGATVAFLAALVVPPHFSSLQHLGLFNKEASRERRGAGREKNRVSIQFCLNYPRVCVLTLIKKNREEIYGLFKGRSIMLKSASPKQDLNFACPWGNSFFALKGSKVHCEVWHWLLGCLGELWGLHARAGGGDGWQSDVEQGLAECVSSSKGHSFPARALATPIKSSKCQFELFWVQTVNLTMSNSTFLDF